MKKKKMEDPNLERGSKSEIEKFKKFNYFSVAPFYFFESSLVIIEMLLIIIKLISPSIYIFVIYYSTLIYIIYYSFYLYFFINFIKNKYYISFINTSIIWLSWLFYGLISKYFLEEEANIYLFITCSILQVVCPFALLIVKFKVSDEKSLNYAIIILAQIIIYSFTIPFQFENFFFLDPIYFIVKSIIFSITTFSIKSYLFHEQVYLLNSKKKEDSNKPDTLDDVYFLTPLKKVLFNDLYFSVLSIWILFAHKIFLFLWPIEIIIIWFQTFNLIIENNKASSS